MMSVVFIAPNSDAGIGIAQVKTGSGRGHGVRSKCGEALAKQVIEVPLGGGG